MLLQLSRVPIVSAVAEAGFKAIILTVDAIGQGSSDEYVRLGTASSEASTCDAPMNCGEPRPLRSDQRTQNLDDPIR